MLSNCDIVAISELKHAFPFSFPGFSVLRSRIIDGEEHRGGVAVCIKPFLVKFIHNVRLEYDQVWFQLTLTADVWWGACYVPPRDSPFYKNESFAKIQEFCTQGKVIILGDLNARMPNLDMFNSTGVTYQPNPDRGSNANGCKVASLCADFGLVPLNHRQPLDIISKAISLSGNVVTGYLS